MDYLFVNGFSTPEATAKLRDSDCYPLVRELVFKFDLRVLREVNKKWFMCHPNGVAVGKANVILNNEGKTEYQFYSPYFRKQRGSDENGKHTLSSVKLASLMTSIKKIDAIPKQEDHVAKFMQSAVGSAVENAKHSLGRNYKSHNLHTDTVHALLAHFFNENPNSLNLSIPLELCKETFDKLNEADRVRNMKEQLVIDTFHKPFYIVGVDGFNDFSVGKMRIIESTDHILSEVHGLEVIEPFRRYKNIVEDYPALMPILTMAKVTYEGKASLAGGYVPIVETFDSGLSAAFTYTASIGHYNSIYMVTPC